MAEVHKYWAKIFADPRSQEEARRWSALGAKEVVLASDYDALQSENERLREALREIDSIPHSVHLRINEVHLPELCPFCIAHVALAAPDGTTEENNG